MSRATTERIANSHEEAKVADFFLLRAGGRSSLSPTRQRERDNPRWRVGLRSDPVPLAPYAFSLFPGYLARGGSAGRGTGARGGIAAGGCRAGEPGAGPGGGTNGGAGGGGGMGGAARATGACAGPVATRWEPIWY